MDKAFKPIKGYEGLYEINENGDVYSLNFRGSKKRVMLKKTKEGSKYVIYTLCKDKKQTKIRGHRLVALNFIENPNNYPFINHINGIKHDNRVENLEWCTCKMNNDHANRTGLRNIKGSAHGRSKLTEDEVIKIREIKSQKKITDKEIALMFKCSQSLISLIVNRKNWTHI